MSKQRLNFATYPQDYYTGAQARIYFGSTWVDDIATISYQSSHSKTPLYGYGDHQFRTVAKGQFLVRGSFTIAFKETGYLYSIMQLVKGDKAGLHAMRTTQEASAKDALLKYIGSGYTVEQALDLASDTPALKDLNIAKDSSDFEDISEVLEDAIWGKPGTPAALARKIPRSDELDYFKHTDNVRSDSDIDINGFDILLTFGNYKSGSDSAEHTMISINDVHITGESMVVSPSAEPIGLTCEFFARGLNERISSVWPEKDKESVKNANDDAKTPIEKAKDKMTDAKEPTKNPDPTITTPAPAVTPASRNVTQTNNAPANFNLTANWDPTKPNVDLLVSEQPFSLLTNTVKSDEGQIVGFEMPKSNIPEEPKISVQSFAPIKGHGIVCKVKGDPTTALNKAKQQAANLVIPKKIFGMTVNVNCPITIKGDINYGKLDCNELGTTVHGTYTMVGDKIQIDITTKPTFSSWAEIDSRVHSFFND